MSGRPEFRGPESGGKPDREIGSRGRLKAVVPWSGGLERPAGGAVVPRALA